MRVALIVITIVVLAVTGAALALGWEGALTRRRDPVTVDAYVAGDRTPLSSHLSGYVRTVLVRDNQSVRAGDTIVQMVDDDYRAMAAEVQAQADAARTVGLSRPRMPARRSIMAVLISPLIVPVIITAVGAYLFYAPIGLANSFIGIIIAQTTVASPFVVVTVGASLASFDRTLMRAAAISGARPLISFQRVMLPLIFPGVLSGAAFAFVASFDELVIALFLAGPQQRTLPMQMFVGLREHLDPTITAAATLMMSLSILLLIVADRLRRRH